jgi:hypothetical protein
VTDVSAEVLRTVAGPDLYRTNAFRITGLSTYADRRAVSRRRQQVLTSMSMGVDTAFVPTDADPDEVRAAFDRLLEDPRRRLVDELFWLWDVPGADCSCPGSLHREHDRAAIAHGHVLAQEAAGGSPAEARHDLDRLWGDAAHRWDALLRRAATWEHVRHRVRALDDRRIDESVVDTLRAELPTALMRPLVALTVAAERPERLVGHLRRWPGRAVLATDLLEESASPLFEEISAAVTRTRALLDDGALDDAVSTVLGAVATADRLRTMLPPDSCGRTATACETVAVALNNCATRLFERSVPAVGDRVDRLLDTAVRYAVQSETVEAIRANAQSFRDVEAAVDETKRVIARTFDSGQREVALQMAAQMRRQFSSMPGAVAEIDDMVAGFRKNAAYHQTGRWRGIRIAILVLILLLCIALNRCANDDSGALQHDTGSAAVTAAGGRALYETGVAGWPGR